MFLDGQKYKLVYLEVVKTYLILTKL